MKPQDSRLELHVETISRLNSPTVRIEAGLFGGSAGASMCCSEQNPCTSQSCGQSSCGGDIC